MRLVEDFLELTDPRVVQLFQDTDLARVRSVGRRSHVRVRLEASTFHGLDGVPPSGRAMHGLADRRERAGAEVLVDLVVLEHSLHLRRLGHMPKYEACARVSAERTMTERGTYDSPLPLLGRVAVASSRMRSRFRRGAVGTCSCRCAAG